MPRAAAIIPARFASTRLPGKPLLRDTGKYLIQHVWERVRSARTLPDVVVATDDPRIAEAVESFGGAVVMTSAACRSGTDRCAEAARAGVIDPSCDVVVNVQGDEPEVDPEHLDALVALAFEEGSKGEAGAPVSTLAEPITDPADHDRSQVVKAVVDPNGYALYFSRTAVPFLRPGHESAYAPLRHIGIYAFERGYLDRFPGLPPAPLELAEGLEQLRVLSHGRRIRVGVLPAGSGGRGIDTPEDYEDFVRRSG